MSKKKRSNLLEFPEPPPQMDVSDPRWPKAFAEWSDRKAKFLGMEDPMEFFARCLGMNKQADQYAERRRQERRKNQQRLEDMSKSANNIYGKTNKV